MTAGAVVFMLLVVALADVGRSVVFGPVPAGKGWRSPERVARYRSRTRSVYDMRTGRTHRPGGDAAAGSKGALARSDARIRAAMERRAAYGRAVRDMWARGVLARDGRPMWWRAGA